MAIIKNLVRPMVCLHLAILTVLSVFSSAWGLHSNLPCVACHNRPADGSTNYSSEDLVQPKDILCLTCHDGSLDVSGLTPPYVLNGREDLAGGSFAPTLYTDGVGHNVQSIDRTLGSTPPGGVPLAEFGCLSCHDAHDNGNYRNLKKKINGYSTLVEAVGDPNFKQNDYISGMNAFCGACHEKFNNTRNARGARGWTQHPVGIAIYGAQHADFEYWSRLATKVTQAEYPSGNPADTYAAQVFCLSCHRAHASPYKNSLRWDHAQKPQGCLECHPF